VRPISSTMPPDGAKGIGHLFRDAMFESLKRSDLPLIHKAVLRRATSTRPTIWIVEEKGVRAVVKDFSGNRALFRHTAGRFLVWREKRAYRKLQGLAGVPRLYRVLDGLALVLEEIPARSVEKLEREMVLPESFFEALEDLVRRIHERGLAHCDLKRAPNVLLGRDGLPYIVDWGASISKGECRLPPFNLIYRRFLRDDEDAVTKLKLRHLPHRVSSERLRRYRHRGLGERIVRGIRDRLRDWLQKVA